MKYILICLTLFISFAALGNVFEEMAKLPKTSKAMLKRGKTLTEVDLASNPKIQDYDVLLLEDGVYSTLGNFTAKHVRVVGNGKRRTFISSMAKGSSPILVNSTEFWDVTVADAQFKVVDVNGMWAINVEFAGAILVRPAALDKSPGFAIRAAFTDVPTEDGVLYTSLKVDANPEALLKFEDNLDKNKDMNLRDRAATKGIIARAANYLYQTKKLSPKYDQAKYNQLTKQAQSAKAKGHLYVSLLAWAEADRVSGHSRFDEVLKEISPLSQNLSQECGCTVEGQGLAATVKTEIEQKLFARIPISSLPGRCKIQTLHVNNKPGSTKEALISAARLQADLDKAATFRDREETYERTMLAHASGSNESIEVFEVGAPPLMATAQYTVVADVEMPGVKKTFAGDVVKGKNDNSSFLSQSIIDPIAKAFNDRFASKIKAATAKMNSKDLIAKVDGLIEYAFYGADPSRQTNYEELHEQQFGRKVSSVGAMSSVFAY